jgi:hypothetical protein
MSWCCCLCLCLCLWLCLCLCLCLWLWLCLWGLLTVDCWLFSVDCCLFTVDCRLSTVECILWDMNFVLGKIGGQNIICYGAMVPWWCRLCLFLYLCLWVLLTVDFWVLTLDSRMHIVEHELPFGKNLEEKYCLLWCHGAVACDYCCLLTVACRMSNAGTSFWEKDEGKHCLLWCHGGVACVCACTCACEYCRLSTACCGTWTSLLENDEGKHCLLWCPGAVACEDCWLLTIDCWLLTVDCRMHIVGHELRFGKTMRENIICYGAMVPWWCRLCLCLCLWVLLTVDYWPLTVDCWLSNAFCGTWTSFWEKDEGKHCLLWCHGAVACDYCWLSTVECMLWDINLVLGKRWGKTLSVMIAPWIPIHGSNTL